MPKVPRRPSPELLESLHPEVRTVPAGSVIWRVYHRGGLHPTNWRDFRYVGPIDARFDHHDGDEPARQDRAVLYGADHPATCLAEVFQKTRVINRWHKDPWLVGFETRNPTRLVDLTGTFPTRAGASMGLMTGPRSVSRAWARAFHDAWPEIQGLYYPSSIFSILHANLDPTSPNSGQERIARRWSSPSARRKRGWCPSIRGSRPRAPRSLHRSLGDPAIFSILRNAARELGYALL